MRLNLLGVRGSTPAPGADFAAVRRAARRTGELLREIGLEPFAQVTGSKGIHVWTPLRRRATFADVRPFARAVAELLVSRHPDELTLEFRKAEPLPPAEPLISPDGEAFWSRDLDAFAYLQFLRVDGNPGLRFPITKPEVTILGRESRPGKPVDIALPNDEWASGQHAQIRRDEGRFLLEDLGSRNGTFVQLLGQSEILPGDILLVGRVLLRAVDPLRAAR